MSWYINGVKHTGQVLTVGPTGRDFTHPQDAYAAAEAGALILCDIGLYDLKNMGDTYYAFNAGNKAVYIRGLGQHANEVVFSNTFGSYGTFFFRYGAVENIRFLHKPAAAWTRALAYYYNDTQMVFSKCEIDASVNPSQYPLASEWMESHVTGFVKFLNCRLKHGFADMTGQNGSNWAIDLSRIYVVKCEVTGALVLQYYKGSLAVNDNVPNPQSGYGTDYGEFIIQQVDSLIVTTNLATDVLENQFRANGTIGGFDSVNTRGFCYREGEIGDPSLLFDAFVSEDGLFGEGSYSLLITGTEENTPYRVRAFAINGDGVVYGETITVMPENIRYWVGKRGSYFATENWSLHSGGVGGASVPDETCKVVIDQNSFDGRGQFISFKD